MEEVNLVTISVTGVINEHGHHDLRFAMDDDIPLVTASGMVAELWRVLPELMDTDEE